MKKYLLIVTLLTNFLAQSQLNRGGMRNGRQRQMVQNPRKAPEPNFQVEKYLGIVIYDIEKAAKKINVKTSSTKGVQFSKLITNYNKEIKEIKRINSFTLRSTKEMMEKRINSFTLRSTKEMMENFQKKARETRDFSNRTKVQKKMVESLTPISEALKVKDRKFDAAIKNILSEKEYKKWVKYNRKMYKVFPKEDSKEE